MTLGKRLFATFGGITLLAVGPALFAVSRLTELRNIALEQRAHHAVALEALGELQAALADIDRFVRSYVAVPGDRSRLGMNTASDSARAKLGHIAETGYRRVVQPTALRLDSLDASIQRIESLVQSGAMTRATDEIEPISELMKRTQRTLVPVADSIDVRSAREVSEAMRISESAASATLLVAALAFLLSLLIVTWTTRAVSVPLKRLAKATSEVAGGQFMVPRDLPYEREDEIGDLSRSFRVMAEQLAELDRLKAEFVSVASHELKTPINVIGGYVELMEDGMYGAITDEQREVLDRVTEQVDSLTRQVNQLLDVSRIEAGGFKLHAAEVALAELMAIVRRTFEPLAEQKRIHFSADIDDGAPASIVADPDRLRNELLGNLISNAFKFTPEGGEIRVHTTPHADGGVRIEVSDTGRGIPRQDLPFIFDKFYQVGSEARSRGSGLGLAIAKQVAEAHGGDLTVVSEVDHGTTFRIDLPAGSPASVPATA